MMKTTYRHFVSMGLAACLVLSSAGCGKTVSESESNASSAAMTSESASNEEVVTLTWFQPGVGQPDNYAEWQAHVNEYLEEKIGVHLDVQVIPWGDWDNRRNVLVKTGGNYDILFTDFKTYASDVELGAFMNISELIPECAPELYEMIPEDYWRASSVKGELYAVPTLKDSSMTQYFIWDQAMLDKYDLDVSDLHTLADIDEPLRTIHEGENEPVFILNQNGVIPILNVYDQMGTGLPAIGVRYDDESATVVATLEQPDVKENLSILHQWYNEGIINSDAAIHPEDSSAKICSFGQGWSLAAKTTWGPTMGIDALAVQWGDTIVSNDTVRGSLNCISSSCDHPEKALELLQLANTDTHFRDMLYYGLEGDNFEYTADGKVEKKNDDWSMAGYTQATFFNVSQLSTDTVNQWDEVRELNEQASASVLLGFDLDTTAVNDSIINCVEIYNRYKSELLTGTKEPEETIEKMMQEMRAAGFDDILNEAQRQVDEFMNK